MEADFSGYATKANLKCSDGRTITPEAFKHQDQTTVPLVWQHGHNDYSNVLGHAVLQHREDGVYALGFFNDSEQGLGAKKLVEHKDIVALSIYANRLVEKSKVVLHGEIREVSLVLAGANPGALIDHVNVRHSDGELEELDDEAIIHTGLMIEVPEVEEEPTDVVQEEEVVVPEVKHADSTKTVADVFETLNEEQKAAVFFILGKAINGDVQHGDTDVSEIMHSLNEDQAGAVAFMVAEALEEAKKKDSAAHADGDDTGSEDSDTDDNTAAHADNQKGSSMTRNVFETQEDGKISTGTKLSHADMEGIFKAAKRGGSLKDAVEGYATDTLAHGIDDIDILFPDAKAITSSPDWLKRRTEWVAEVMTGTRHTPFSRIKSMTANLTLEEARAKGYIKGNLKKEEFFRVAKRVTTPQTIYKKQQLDRDDILDITDFDVVAWLKAEMRIMLEEEIARAVLVGDGRSNGDPDKISEDHVRSIANDDDFYATQLYINLGDNASSSEEIVDALIMNRRHYRGSGNPTFFCGETVLSQMLMVKDTLGRRIYSGVADLQVAMRVSKIVTVEIMDEPTSPVVGIVVNLSDYNIGADRGGDVALFDDFDIDYNQFKYLIETRLSGALVKAKSALVLRKVASNAVLVDPVAPSFNATNHQVTVATTTGVVYKNKLSNTTLTTGSPVTLAAGDELRVVAVPSTGYYLASTAGDEFLFTYERGRTDAGL